MSRRIPLALLVWVLCMSAEWGYASVSALQDPDPLPAGKGREILEAACTSCHEFEEITKLRGTLDREGWRTVVKTMIDYGAEVNAKDLDVLVDYLAQHLGKRE